MPTTCDAKSGTGKRATNRDAIHASSEHSVARATDQRRSRMDEHSVRSGRPMILSDVPTAEQCRVISIFR
jgi:hypothetical protein